MAFRSGLKMTNRNFAARWPLGTREQVAFDVLRQTGLRRGDAVRVGRPHVRNGIIKFATEKTGERVAIIVSVVLAEAVAAGPCGDLTFIASASGRPMSKEASATGSARSPTRPA